MDIYAALKSDHDALKPLLDSLVLASEENRDTKVILAAIRQLLVPHSRAEEATFYNALRAHDADTEMVNKHFVEHVVADGLLQTLRTLKVVGAEPVAAAMQLRSALLEHIENEEDKLFTAARLVFTEQEAMQMGLAFVKMKASLQKHGDLRNILDVVANLMPSRFASTTRNYKGEL